MIYFEARKDQEDEVFLLENLLHFVLECTEYHKYVKFLMMYVHFKAKVQQTGKFFTATSYSGLLSSGAKNPGGT